MLVKRTSVSQGDFATFLQCTVDRYGVSVGFARKIYLTVSVNFRGYYSPSQPAPCLTAIRNERVIQFKGQRGQACTRRKSEAYHVRRLYDTRVHLLRAPVISIQKGQSQNNK